MSKKEKIMSLSYDAVFKSIFINNQSVFGRMVCDTIGIDYEIYKNDISIQTNELEVEFKDEKRLVCDYVVKIGNHIIMNLEMNRFHYRGLLHRNLAYCFKIYSRTFSKGKTYSDFDLLKIIQVNYNLFPNSNGKIINKQMICTLDEVPDIVTDNFVMYQIDIAKAWKFVYNNSNKKEISKIIRWAALLYAQTFEDISAIIGDDMMTKEEKEKFLRTVSFINKDIKIGKAVSLENDAEYQAYHVMKDGLERGIEQGKEYNIPYNIPISMDI